MRRLINQLVPFLIIGIVVIALAFGIVLLAYLFLFGALVGFFLYFVNWVRLKLFPPQKPTVKTKSGRIIDSDDFRQL